MLPRHEVSFTVYSIKGKVRPGYDPPDISSCEIRDIIQLPCVGSFASGFVAPDAFIGLRGGKRLSPEMPFHHIRRAPGLHSRFGNGAGGSGVICSGTLRRVLRGGDLGIDDCRGRGDSRLSLPSGASLRLSVSPSFRLFILEGLSTTPPFAGLLRGRGGARLRRTVAARRMVSADALGRAGGSPADSPPVSDRAPGSRVARRRLPAAAGAQPHAVRLGDGAEGRHSGPDGRIHFPDSNGPGPLRLGAATAGTLARPCRRGALAVSSVGSVAWRIGIRGCGYDVFRLPRRLCHAGLLG